MSNMNIQNESAEFLRLQTVGCCSTKCQNRLTKLQLAYSSKELCNKLYSYLNDLYFGVSKMLEVELSKLENLFNEIKSKVSQCEKDLIDYIWMLEVKVKLVSC